MGFNFYLIDNTNGSEGNLLAEGSSEQKLKESMNELNQRRTFSFYAYTLHDLDSEGIFLTQKRYGLDHTCKKGEWKTMTGPNTIYIPKSHKDIRDKLVEILSK